MTGHGRRPRLVAPPGACDTHSHVYVPRAACPHVPGRTPNLVAELPAYEAMLARLGIERAVVVQPSLYGFDNRVTLESVAAMGASRARGIAVCRPDVTPAQLRALHERGIRGLRFFLLVDDVGLDVIEPMARLCADLGWHVVVQGRGDWLRDALPVLRRLPCPVVIDHLGRTPAEAGVDHAGFRGLLGLMAGGGCWVKISAPYLSSGAGPPAYEDVAPRVRALLETRPDRLLWGANWPHPNSPVGAKPDEADCLDPLLDWVPDDATRRAILADNAAVLYGF
jgi:D-galactarolactone isomerase